MYDDKRESAGHRHDRDERRNESSRGWRRGEERYRREAQGSWDQENRFDDDRWDSDRRDREFGYGRAYRDDDFSGRVGYGRDANWRDQRDYGLRDYYSAGRSGNEDRAQIHWHEQDRERRAGHPYSGTYGGTGDSSYFTGSQGSWAVGDPRVQRSQYGAQHFGSDYRRHGYDRDDDRRGFWDRASDEVASWFGDEDAARRRDEDHRGRGPKDYTRSDERIREDANDRLTEDWRVDASNITVTVDKGEVTLNGTVTNREAKRRAEDIVEDLSGVKHVQNNLRVQAASGTAYTGNWATNQTSTAEGGTLSQSNTDTTRQTTKV